MSVTSIGSGLSRQERAVAAWMKAALLEGEPARYGVSALAEHEVVAAMGWETGGCGPGIGFDYDGEGAPHRVRLLNRDGPGKYTQREGSGNRVLVPQGHGYFEGPAQTIPTLFITEGEKKAHALTALGAPCLGIGGVGNWSQRDSGTRVLHEEIEPWRAVCDRVAIVFDSDATTNDNVAREETLLAKTLRDLGSEVLVLRVPMRDDGSAQGIDDYLERWPTKEERFTALLALVEEAVDHEHQLMLACNARWKLIWNREGGSPYVLDTSRGISRLRLSTFDALHAGRRVLVPNLRGKLVERPIASWWRAHRRVETYDRVGFHTSVSDPTPPGVYNLYTPPSKPAGYKPARWRPVKQFLAHAIPDERTRQYVLAWVGYAVQTGNRARWCLFVHGPQGTSKTFLGALLGACFGQYYRRIEIGDLAVDRFGKKHLECARFLQADEGGSDEQTARALAKMLKAPITEDLLTVEEKHVPSYQIDNKALIYLSSNHPDTLYVDPHDRRTMVLEMATKLPAPVTRALNVWLRGTSDEGAEVLANRRWQLWEFFQEVSIPEEFDPYQPPDTEARITRIEGSRSDMESECHDLVVAGKWFGRAIEADVVVLESLLLASEGYGRGQIRSKKALSTVLQAAGAMLVRTTDTRYYVLRQHAKWMQAKPKELAAEAQKSVFPGISMT